MKLTNLSIRDLFTPESKLTFIVGAGCSVDQPTCLLPGRPIMNAIINFMCAKPEINKIKNLEMLRLEQVIEIYQDYVDKDFILWEFFELNDKPNMNHFYLAEMIKKGNFVITTNNDFLIEHALLQLGIPKEDIIPVITKEDFKRYDDPKGLTKNGKKVLYKMHGSTKNIITGEKTRDSLIITTRDLGSNKEGINVFQLEPFKQPAFKNLTTNRSLVVMGYSGSDDFDIIPAMKVLKHVQDIIWINYVHNDEGKELIVEIEPEKIENNICLTKIDQFLVELKHMVSADHVFRVDVNYNRMVKELITSKIKVSSENFSIDLYEWLSFHKEIKPPDVYMKLYIPYKLYYNFGIYDNGMICSEKILHLAEESGNQGWEALAHKCIGEIYHIQGNYPKALKQFEKALRINEHLVEQRSNTDREAIRRHFREIADIWNNIGEILRIRGDFHESLKRYEEALEIDEKLGDLMGKAKCLRGIASIHFIQGNYSEALNRYEESLIIAEKLGDLIGKATDLNNIAEIFKIQGLYPETIRRYEEAVQINRQLENLLGVSLVLSNIGELYFAQSNYPDALKVYEESLRIAEQLGELRRKAIVLKNIAQIYRELSNYPEAFKRFEEAQKIYEVIGDTAGLASTKGNIGILNLDLGNLHIAKDHFKEAYDKLDSIGFEKEKAVQLRNTGLYYNNIGQYKEASDHFKESKDICEQIGDLDGKAVSLSLMGLIFGRLGNINITLENLQESYEIHKKLNNHRMIAKCLNQIGNTNYKQGNNSEALKNYEKALQIYKRIGNNKEKASTLGNIGETFIAYENYSEALKKYEEALKIFELLGDLKGKSGQLNNIISLYLNIQNKNR